MRGGPPGAQPKEYEIAVRALGRPESFDPKIDPIVRVSIASIRERLQRYFETEGAAEEWRLAIPKGQYRPSFTKVTTTAASVPSSSPALDAFWQPYLTGAHENLLIFTELLFFRNEAGNFLRNVFVNDLRDGKQQMQERFDCVNFDEYEPSFHFVSAGEMHCLLGLVRMFGSGTVAA